MLFKGLVKSSFFVFSLRIFGVVLIFSFSLFLTNFYPASIVGQYDFVRSLIMILSGVALLGTNQSIIYYSGILKSEKSFGSIKKIYLKMLLLIVATTGFMGFLFFIAPNHIIIGVFNKNEVSELITLSLQGLFFYSVTLLNIDTIRALNHTYISELFRNIFRYVPVFVFAIILYTVNRQEELIFWFVFGFLILFIISTIFVFSIIFKKNFPNSDSTKIKTKAILVTSLPMALSAISYFLMQSIDVIILGAYNTFEEIAYYSISVKLATFTALALVSVNVVIAPKIAKIYNDKNFSKLKMLIKQSSRITFGVSVPILIILGFFSEPILFLFGDNYIAAKNALLILLVGQLFNSVSGPAAIYLNMTGRQRVLNVILAFGLILNILLNIILIPMYGIEGAAFATSFSMAIWNIAAVVTIFSMDRVKTFIS